MNIKSLREQKHLTQEELARESGISIRTIQRIEAGQEPKGHTLKVLAKALELDLTSINKKATAKRNYSLIKIINLSSAFVLSIPLLNVLLPLTIMYFGKQFNDITKQILSLQILWSTVSLFIFILASFLKNSLNLSHRFPLWVLLVFIIINMVIILINAASLGKKKKLFFKLNFNVI
ncbi:helix-turn-helix transcriptional regulator [Maribacter sp. PR1]|uniref:Helix-turn-helix transcriptional regulator n=1 Tax=Maribacter cobaltidurans TaxID=1178778 RepID=A0ABU7ISU4_9FLAO|nr:MULTISPECIES: helix-turn-helix transcriptional regulator [Maribacter]MDC6388556.1 helix-turn-helix transcriptional regulator [Maribacter sp. PR1]MEE1975945.1 helix-turn-helix transcriptional regulator [Maribacter cobaltidurans]